MLITAVLTLLCEQGVPIEVDKDLYCTDLGKCIKSLIAVEQRTNEVVSLQLHFATFPF
jgi:hypothetical protein